MSDSRQLIIQIVLILGIALVGLMLTRSTAGARHQAIRRILLVVFLLFAVFAVMFPNLLTRVAHFVGVGRGTDLLLYGLVIAFFAALATQFRRFAALEDKITALAREVALLTADRSGEQAAAAGLVADDATPAESSLGTEPDSPASSTAGSLQSAVESASPAAEQPDEPAAISPTSSGIAPPAGTSANGPAQ